MAKTKSYLDRLQEKRDLQILQRQILESSYLREDDFERLNNSEDKMKQMVRRYRRVIDGNK